MVARLTMMNPQYTKDSALRVYGNAGLKQRGPVPTLDFLEPDSIRKKNLSETTIAVYLSGEIGVKSTEQRFLL